MTLIVPSDVEANADKIIQLIGYESVDVYRFLSKRFREQDPKGDNVFQFIFRSFYRLDNAGLTDEFKTKYFELLSFAKAEHQADIQEIVRSLFNIPNCKEQKSLQFSFATKLAATVESSSPIYDTEVASIFGFRPPYNYKPFEQRLSEYTVFYTELKSLYQTIIDTDCLRKARTMFRDRYQCTDSDVPETKVLDFIFGLLESYRVRCSIDT